jgi:hypothetical protein
MKPLDRTEILDHGAYDQQREAFRAQVMKIKESRRVHIGDHLTLLFENRVTIRYQIQEMMRAEWIVREEDILHEIETYNELLGKEGEIGCTLLIEIEDAEVRNEKLKAWWSLPEKIYVLCDDGSRITAAFDPRQRGDGRLSSVQYLKFDTGGRIPVSVGVDLPDYRVETRLTGDQKQALREDFAADA